MACALQKFSYGKRKKSRKLRKRRKFSCNKFSRRMSIRNLFRRRKSTKRRRRKSRRKSRRFGQAQPQVVRLNFLGRRSRRKHKSRRKSKSHRRRRRHSILFGRMPNGQQIMGNYRPAAQMNTYQEYLGMNDSQRATHLKNIALSDRSNFYSNV